MTTCVNWHHYLQYYYNYCLIGLLKYKWNYLLKDRYSFTFV